MTDCTVPQYLDRANPIIDGHAALKSLLGYYSGPMPKGARPIMVVQALRRDIDALEKTLLAQHLSGVT